MNETLMWGALFVLPPVVFFWFVGRIPRFEIINLVWLILTVITSMVSEVMFIHKLFGQSVFSLLCIITLPVSLLTGYLMWAVGIRILLVLSGVGVGIVFLDDGDDGRFISEIHYISPKEVEE